MKRRPILLAAAFAPLALEVRAQGQAPQNQPGQAQPVVINVAAANCPYCTMWTKQYKADWLASPLYRKVRYVETTSPAVASAYEARYWPADLKPVLDRVPRKSGTPRFIIAQNNGIVFNEFGVNTWVRLLDRLQTLVG